MIHRELAKKLLVVSKKFPIVAVVGPRQSGKTTLTRNTFPSHKYVLLEDLDTREFAKSDPRGFLKTYSSGVILDEVQRAPELFSYLQGIVDQAPEPGRFILTGSQNFLLYEKISQSLAGRVAFLTLQTLSLSELASSGYAPAEASQLLWQGTYPRLYGQHITPQEWYSSYIQTYVERDVRLVKNISDLSTFQKFIRLCAGRIGQLLNLSSLAHDLGISHATASSWLSVLEASFLVFLLQPHTKNFNKRLVKMPKLYFYDTGLAVSLLGISDPAQLELHPLKGAVFESLVISELSKRRFNQGTAPNVFFWRDKIGHEIDCVVETSGGLIPIEIKSGKTVADDFFRELEYWNRLAEGDPERSFVVYGGDESQIRSKGNLLGWKDLNRIPVE